MPNLLIPHSPEWVREISRTIGGSSAAAAVGCGRFAGDTPLNLWRRIRAARAGADLPQRVESDDLRRGRIMEPVALTLARETLGLKILAHHQGDILAHQLYPWAHCLPDGWVGGVGSDEIVEVKVPRPGTVARIQASGIPQAWTVQAQHNMTVLEARTCHELILDPVGAFLVHVPIAHDLDQSTEIMEAEQRFWSYVLDDIEPNEEAPALETVPAPAGADYLVLDSPDAQQAARNFLRLRDLVSEAEETRDEAKARLIALAGSCSPDYFEVAGVNYTGEDGVEWLRLRCHHKAQAGRESLDEEKVLAKLAELGIDPKAYLKRSAPSRPFRVYPG